MSTTSQSPSWRVDARAVALLAAALGIAVLLLSWALLYHGFYARGTITDVPLYEHYGDAVVGGAVPYRDFGLEYPPAALPVFVLPAVGNAGDSSHYERRFSAEMWFCAAVALLACALALRSLRAPPARVLTAVVFVAVAPLLLGSLVRLRFDLWPAALTACAVAALLAERRLLSLAFLGIAVAAKLYAFVLVPLALVYVWRRAGAEAARRACAAFAVALGVCVVPFLVLAPSGLADSLIRQTSRPLQIESLGAAFLLLAHHVAGTHLVLIEGHGSQNLGGGAANALATVLTVVQALVIVALWVLFARGDARPERFARFAAAAVCAFVAFGKVLSPQFMIWLVPLVPLVRGRRGAAATAMLAALLVGTQLWFPYRYWALALHFAAIPSSLVILRDFGLVALFALLVYETRTRTESHEVARPS